MGNCSGSGRGSSSRRAKTSRTTKKYIFSTIQILTAARYKLALETEQLFAKRAIIYQHLKKAGLLS